MRLKELENWLSASEAAGIIGISRQAVVKRCEEGRLRAVKTHLGWLIDPRAVKEAPKPRKED